MKLGSLNRGEAIAALSAIALLVVMFLGWYGAAISGQVGDVSYVGLSDTDSAWSSLGWISVVLVVTILFALGAALSRLGGSSWTPAIPLDAAVAVLGGLSTLAILWRILDPPDFGSIGGVGINANVKAPAYVGLAAAAGIAYGGYRAMGQRGTSFAQVADELAVKPAQPFPGKPSKSSEKRPEPRI